MADEVAANSGHDDLAVLIHHLRQVKKRMRGRGREGGREKEAGREEEREGGKEGEREERRQLGGRKRGREGKRERGRREKAAGREEEREGDIQIVRGACITKLTAVCLGFIARGVPRIS